MTPHRPIKVLSQILLLLWIASASAQDLVAELGLRAAPDPVRLDPEWRPAGPIVVRIMSNRQLDVLRQVAGDAELIGVKTDQQALEAIPGASAVLGFCTPEIVAAAPRLHWIQIYWAGAEGCIEVLKGAERPLLLTNMQRVASSQIAEHVLAMMLGLSRGLAPHIRDQESGQWRPGRVPFGQRQELGGRTLLLVGLGGIGTAVARKVQGLDMRVIAIRASGRPGPDFVDEVARPDRLLQFAAEADVVVNSVPLTPETEGLFDAKFFAAMKPSAFFINVGRGRSVVQDDLVAALLSDGIAGAGLDVTDPEPLPADHPLWQMSNVIITPHVAAGSDRAFDRVMAVTRENLLRYISGEPMLSVVDQERGY